jgi:hypothetical protein
MTAASKFEEDHFIYRKATGKAVDAGRSCMLIPFDK